MQDPASVAVAAGASMYGVGGDAAGVLDSASGALGSAFRAGMFASFVMLAGGRALYEAAVGVPSARHRVKTSIPPSYVPGTMLAAVSSGGLHAGHMTPAAGLFAYGLFNYSSLAVISGKAAVAADTGSFNPAERAPTQVMPDFFFQLAALFEAHLVPLDERTGEHLSRFRTVPFSRNDDGTFTRHREHGDAEEM
jgi:hypothetical protein